MTLGRELESRERTLVQMPHSSQGLPPGTGLGPDSGPEGQL